MENISLLDQTPLGYTVSVHSKIGTFMGILVRCTTKFIYLLDEDLLHKIPNEEAIGFTYHEIPKELQLTLLSNMYSTS